MLSTAELGACTVFVSYFAVIAVLFSVIASDLLARARALQSVPKGAYGFLALAVGSFAHTWFYMFKFMAWSFADYEASTTPSGNLLQRISHWLLDTSLFEQAWARVCFGTMNWWWSQQLCLYTVGKRYGVARVWTYMLLGQLVAISVASNLFYLALALSAPTRVKPAPRTHIRATVYLPVLLSMGTVALSPFTNERTFLPNLLLMHTLIVLPLFSSSPTQLAHKSRWTVPVSTLFTTLSVFASVLHVRQTYLALITRPTPGLGSYLQAAWTTLYSHPAQSSIGWDVVWTSASLLVWAAASSPITAVVYAVLMPFCLLATLALNVLQYEPAY
ncbi:hypothetical protein HMN09_00831900 [Mycena chlorophos]|uniref:Uncharacterized protein n=1 Tax=Mycena chlorophos TaxID=658473 RepID=A0A8H6ST95_MYCCL|nr:hypothetical protein HMN09_00831900 [Mycena chlorophos]